MSTAKIVIRKKKLSNATYPICIRLSNKHQSATYIRLKGMYVSTYLEFDSSLSRFSTKKKDYKELNKLLTAAEDKIDSILTLLEAKNEFTYDNFRAKYNGNTDVDDVIVNVYEDKIDTLRRLGRDGTANLYESSLRVFKLFIGNKKITFEDITYSFLKKFEEQRRLAGNVGNTISIHFRALRALHRDYSKRVDKPLPNVYTTFNIKRLETPTAKRALSKGQLKAFIDYVPQPDTPEDIAKDIFLFSLLARGMNLKDMAHLTDANISDNKIIYNRAKTDKPFTVGISSGMQNIFDKVSNMCYS